jgi:ATP-binding cassette subfamily F protein uup
MSARGSRRNTLAPMILVDADRVAMSRPGKPLFADLSLTVSTGDRLGIVGLNGCGKSTLLRVLGGIDEPEAGTVRRGRDVRVAMLVQNPVLPAGPVLAAVGAGWEAAAVLDHVGMGALADADTATLSGGQAKRVALARTLVTECDLLILDEPTNHLDIDAIAWLEDRLASFRGGLILVTHDRHVLDRVTTKVLELDRGRGHLHDGGYDAYLEGRAEREEQAAKAESTRKILARQELAWLRRGAPARSRKPKARIEAATKIVEARAEGPARSGSLDLTNAGPTTGGPSGAGGRGWGAAGVEKAYPGTPRLGDKVIELHGVGHQYPARGERGGPAAGSATEIPDDGALPGRWLFEGVELLLDNRERLGIVGPNGGGKSTLLDIIAGRRTPAAGTVEVGPTVRLGYYDQVGVTLDLQMRVRDAVAGPTRQPDWQDAALLEQFWFEADAQFAPIQLLSGGERRRLQLLLVLAAKPNVLLLDEPTNDLDLDTLRVLEDFLDEWPGALVVVSHDRAFLERTVTDVVVIDGAGDASRRAGGYAAWEAERRAARSKGGATKRRADAVGAVDAPAPRPSQTVASAAATRSPSTLRHLLKDVDRELAKLDKQRTALEAELTVLAEAAAAPGVTIDHEAMARVGAEMTAVTAAHDAAEERWLEIADELERAQAAR